ETAKSFRRETSLCAVIDRISGGWTYQGWKGGYFDSDEDARIFYDECRWLLFHQKISPTIKQWQCAGRFWAYGHDVSAPSTYLTDYRKGTVRRAEETDLPPHGLVINGTDGALAGEGGVWDLWRRESEILSQGGNCGANLSNIPPTQSSGAATGFSDILKIGDAMARSACGDATTRSRKRRLTIDAAHPDSFSLARRPIEKIAAAEAGVIGTALARRHVQAIIDACACSKPNRSGKKHPSAALQLALQSARQALLPEHMIERTVTLAEFGMEQTPDDVLGDGGDGGDGSKYITTATSGDALTIVSLDGTSMDETTLDEDHVDRLIEFLMVAAWSGIDSGLHFDTIAESWNTCRSSGPIRSASGDGSFMFLDDTASDVWLVNAAAFQEKCGGFDVAGYQHAVELITIAADLSLMTTAVVTPRLARRVWDFRPLSLSITGLGQCLAAAGVAYDGGAGRALAASLAALLTSTAYRASARMAAELGRFPAYEKNAEDMLRVLDRHSDMVATCAHKTSPPGLVEAVEETWSEALRTGTLEGFRNAQVSVLCEAGDLATLLDSETSGVSPLAGLITPRQTPAGYYEKRINPAVPQGLRALGYDEKRITDIVRHVAGQGTLAKAPGVNHETLRKRGFTKAAIDAVEIALSQAVDISQAFNPFVLGEEYCRHMLGFSSAELHDDSFDMLAALGFSDAGIEAANIFCCGAGTLEGAPHLAPEHLPIFDCAEPQGMRGVRCVTTTSTVKLMGALQPHISGAIGQTLPVSASAPLDEFRALLELAWRQKLKSITLQRRQPADSRKTLPDHQVLPAFTVIQGGQYVASSPAPARVKIPQEAEPGIPRKAHSRTVVADGVKIPPTAQRLRAVRYRMLRGVRCPSLPQRTPLSSNGMFDVASP
ncbi:MAG: hypothetical protein O3C49_08905, partial [Proteobacteria bacterium]|nr:hypothetical protein [Pseudomonadota bacterium]